MSYRTAYDDKEDAKSIESDIKNTSEMLESMRMALQARPVDDIRDEMIPVAATVKSDDTDMESNEEMVITKKVFKVGTRNSFIQTFHKFQEKEILLGTNSKSIQDAIMTHSAKTKGNALNRRAYRSSDDGGEYADNARNKHSYDQDDSSSKHSNDIESDSCDSSSNKSATNGSD